MKKIILHLLSSIFLLYILFMAVMWYEFVYRPTRWRPRMQQGQKMLTLCSEISIYHSNYSKFPDSLKDLFDESRLPIKGFTGNAFTGYKAPGAGPKFEQAENLIIYKKPKNVGDIILENPVHLHGSRWVVIYDDKDAMKVKILFVNSSQYDTIVNKRFYNFKFKESSYHSETTLTIPK